MKVTVHILGLVILLAFVRTDPINQDLVPCGKTEVCLLPSYVETFVISCNCSGASSDQCSWINRGEILSNDSLLLWHRNATGYGQYTCIDSFGSAVRKLLILPETNGASCEGCINATICRAKTGNHLLQFSKLFDQSNSPCELFYLDGRPVINVTLTEGKCIPIPPNFNYSIRCPICQQDGFEIYYTILFSNIKDCSNGICGETLTTANMSTVISSAKTSLNSVYPASSTPASTIMPTLPGGSNSNNADENFTGVAVVVVSVGILLLVAMVIIIIIISWLCYKKNKETNANKVTSKSFGGMIATSQDNILNAPSPDINMPDCAIPHEHAFNAPNGALTSIDNATNTGYRGDDHNKATRAERILQLLNCDYKQLSKTITKLHPIIKQHIDFDSLIPFLSFYRIFTDDEMEILMNNNKTKADKVNELITSLPAKDKDGIQNFVKALNDAHEHSGHDVILDNLKEQLFS